MNKEGKIILVTGATGHQGGAVAESLLAGGWPVRALSRNPDKPSARALASRGAEVVKGDLNDRDSLDKALKGVYGVFSVQDFWQHGYEGEVRQGKNLAEASKDCGVEHFIYSSVGGAERKTGLRHFESKWEIEKHIRTLNLPATILRPVFFMFNFDSPLFDLHTSILEGKLPLAMKPDRALQMLAVEDLGEFAQLAFSNPQDFICKEFELAGDELTMTEAAEVFSRVTGREVKFVEVPIEELRKFSVEMAEMFQWFNDKGYETDIPELRSVYPGLMTLEAWLLKKGWDKAA